jgi:hypothetical protein
MPMIPAGIGAVLMIAFCMEIDYVIPKFDE